MSDFPLDSPQQPLSWEQKQTGYDNGETDDAGLIIDPAFSFPWPEDPDERTIVPIKMSLHEYTALLSAVDVGAAIAWTNDALKVYYILVRSLQVPPMAICEQFIECIEDDEDVKQALRDFVINDEDISNYFSQKVLSLTTGQIVGPLFPGDCDNGVIAGRMVAIVERMDGINTDFLEIVEVGTNDEERAAAVLDAIPGISELGIGKLFDFVQGILEDFAENYAAAVTEEWKDEVEEDLYCLAKSRPECDLTFEDLFAYFQNRAGSGLTIGSVISQVINFIIDGDFNTDELVVSGMYALQIGTILAAQKFAGMTLQTMGGLTRDASPSTKWEDWDECVDPLPGCVSFLGGNQGTYIPADDNPFYAQFEAGGIAQVNNTGLTIWGEGYDNIHSVTVTFSEAWSGVNDFYKFFITVSNIDTSNLQRSIDYIGLSTGDTITWTTVGANWTSLRIQIFAGGLTYPPNVANPTEMFITEICVEPTPS